MSLSEYKNLVRICLTKAVKTIGINDENYISSKMKEYNDEIHEFMEEGFSPEAAATAILLNF